MTRLEKIEREAQKARDKISEWQERLKQLDHLRTEQENLQIVHAVRAFKLSREEFSAFLNGGGLPPRFLPEPPRKIPETTTFLTKTEREETPHES